MAPQIQDLKRLRQRVENYKNEEFEDDDSYAIDIMEDLLATLEAPLRCQHCGYETPSTAA
jgi:hypothetical protein